MLCALLRKKPPILQKRLSYFFVSKPRGKIIMMKDADFNNGTFLIRDGSLVWTMEIALIKDKYIFLVHWRGLPREADI